MFVVFSGFPTAHPTTYEHPTAHPTTYSNEDQTENAGIFVEATLSVEVENVEEQDIMESTITSSKWSGWIVEDISQIDEDLNDLSIEVESYDSARTGTPTVHPSPSFPTVHPTSIPDCGEYLPSSEEYSASCVNTTVGSVCDVTCEFGYEIDHFTVYCDESTETWVSEETIECIPLVCPTKTLDIMNGHVTVTSGANQFEEYEQGSEAIFNCDEGYLLVGQDTAYCSQGQWYTSEGEEEIYRTPYCELHTCDALTLVHGHVVYSDSEEDTQEIHHSMTAELSCDDGYFLTFFAKSGFCDSLVCPEDSCYSVQQDDNMCECWCEERSHFDDVDDFSDDSYFSDVDYNNEYCDCENGSQGMVMENGSCGNCNVDFVHYNHYNLDVLIPGHNDLSENERCEYRHSTLIEAQRACIDEPRCNGVSRDGGLCGGKLYEIRAGGLQSWNGFESWLINRKGTGML